ncbi:hypothetical protein N185_00035 [Sinorhizobium sp. GW3]|nr:hypothetical protein N185_00035 [Sinorhizobium sp. GW3]
MTTSSVTLSQIVEVSAAIATTIVVAGYSYAHLNAFALGVSGAPIFGIDDYLRYGTQPELLGISMLLLFFISPFRLGDSTLSNGVSFWSILRQNLQFAVPLAAAAAILGFIHGAAQLDPVFTGRGRVWTGLSTALLMVVGLLFLEFVSAARQRWRSEVTSLSVVGWTFFVLIVGSALLVFYERVISNPNEPGVTYEFSEGVTIPPDARFVIATSNFVAYAKAGGGFFLVAADKIETVTR